MNRQISKLIALSTLIICGIIQLSQAQNFEDTSHIQLSSYVSLHTGFYSTNSDILRQPSAFGLISGGTNLSWKGLSLPFSFTLSSQNRSFQQPFNRFGLSPYYKSLTVHIGWRSMEFSQYTLSGKEFLGIGLELKPKYFTCSVMYGRFQKPVI